MVEELFGKFGVRFTFGFLHELADEIPHHLGLAT